MNDGYIEMAKALGVTRCRGIESTHRYCPQEHQGNGSITSDGRVHFMARPLTRTNTYSFLALVARALDPTIDEDEPWRRVYRIHMEIRRLAGVLHIKDPAQPAHGARAFVLASVAGLPNTVPMRKQAFDWARRGPKRKEVAA